MNHKLGKIVKGIGGFYYVKCGEEVTECRARGNFRNKSILPFVGDEVKFTTDTDPGYVVEIMKRKNCFIRPPISNIDKLLIVSSLANPLPDTLFIDKMLVIAKKNNVLPALCFNKSDLCTDDTSIAEIYTKAGYDVFVTSVKSKCGVKELKKFFCGGITAVCGFSGVGKSSLLNEIYDKKIFQTGEISNKLSRGKHTTRHVELIDIGEDSYLADTPGFSSISLDDIPANDLYNYYPEFDKYVHLCKYRDCNHTNDKFCGVYDAVANGEISSARYENYKILYKGLKDNKEW